MSLDVGQVFAGYTVMARIGGGGFGEVYLARHPRLPRCDALKLLRSDISASAEFRSRFISEADSIAALSHHAIVTVYDRGEEDGRLWIATQYIRGLDAAQLLRKHHPNGMPVDEATMITAEIGEALDYAHRHNLLHRDVKPANILLTDTRDGRRRAVLGDFGIARQITGANGLTATNCFIGTVTYAAPEQLMGAKIDSRADQYALAATAFHLLAGTPPVKDTNPVAVISKRLTLPPPKLAAIRPELAQLDPILSRAMATDPGQRYSSCEAFTRELSRCAMRGLIAPHDTTIPAARPARPQAGADEPTPNPDAVGYITAAYAVDGLAIDIGSLVTGGRAEPGARVQIPVSMLTRHGLLAGATGTGKTKTLQLIAEQLSAAGVPVVMADFKSDLSGLSRPGEESAKVAQRAADTGDSWAATPFPVEFLSFGSDGIGVPVRATISTFGPTLLSKVLGLNPTQQSGLESIFHYADQQGLPLLDLDDLRMLLGFFVDTDEGCFQLNSLASPSSETIEAILRAVINLATAGGDSFFGEPEFEPADLLRVDATGRGVISLFELGAAMRPVTFSTLLMWMLFDLCTYLPEAEGSDKPRLVFVFDEAHLLFKDASAGFMNLVEQTLRRISSKGVGVFFCTQIPSEIPNAVRCQLGTRIQHALRVFTFEQQQELEEIASSYPKPDFYDPARDLTQLGTGEAFITALCQRGTPTPLAWTRVRPPRSKMTTIGADRIRTAAQASPMFLKYGPTIDRDFAYELLAAKMAPAARPQTQPMSRSKVR